MNQRGFLSFGWSSLVLLALCAGVSPAKAEDAPAQVAGRALFNEGVALFNKGEFEAACPRFEASLKQFPGIGTRGKLAECYEKVGRYASAYQAYHEVAQLATRGGDPAREQVASERAKSLEPKLSYITVVLSPANDVTGLVVKRSGREIERAKLGAAEPVDSGTVAIDVTAPGRKPFSGHIHVMQGLSVRFEVPALSPDASANAQPLSSFVAQAARSRPPWRRRRGTRCRQYSRALREVEVRRSVRRWRLRRRHQDVRREG